MNHATADPRLILASASPARTATLAQAGIPHAVEVSEVDEEQLVANSGVKDPAETALLLARAKAENVAEHTENALVLGCDSVFELDGVAYGKPLTAELARERLRAMSGRTGILHTGHWLINTYDGESPTTAGRLASASVQFGTLSDAEIDAYVATGEPLWVAGSFTIDGRGAAFINGVEGDPHTVVGLSVSTLRSLLAEMSFSITDFWNPAA